jgi:DNA-binding transcriptional MerR regulator
MSTLREESFFNLKAVVRQTGLKPDTLRAWERRYGLPSPERSEGKHRLYSQRDIDTIRWLMARQAEGLTIKRAVQLWRQIEAGGQDPLQSAAAIFGQASRPPSPAPVGDAISHLREDWLDACLLYDEAKAEQVLTQAFAFYPPEAVALELLQPALPKAGEGWYQGQVTVQQEHFCSELIVRRLEALIMAAPVPTRPGPILAACPPQENHTIALLLLTYLLRRRGWDVVYLGASVPAERLEATIAAARPHLAILAAQQLHTAATLLDVAEVLQRQATPLAYGGLVFNGSPEVRQRIAGHFLGERLDVAPLAVEALMAAPPLLRPAEKTPEEYPAARHHFLERQGLIEAHLAQDLAAMDMPPHYQLLANRELALNIAAALRLGNMDSLSKEIQWVRGLIRNRGLPESALHGYLTAYLNRARQDLDERGRLVVSWLETIVKSDSLMGT